MPYGLFLEVSDKGHRIIFSKERAFIHGFLSADGCFRHERSKYRIRAWNKDPKIINFYANIIRKVYGKNISEYLNGRTGVRELTIHGKEIHRDFTKFSHCIDSFSWRIPFEHLDEEGLKWWLLGFFEGDGSVDTARGSEKVLVKSANKAGIEQIKEALSRLGIKSKLYGPYHTPKSEFFQLEIRDLKSLKIFYEKIGFISYKKNKLEEILRRKGVL